MKIPPPELDQRAAAQLRQAHEWRLIGLLFERPRAGWRKELRELGASCADPDLARAAALGADAGEGEYHALLRPGGLVSPREAGHRRTGDPTRTLGAIRAFHAAFAFQPASEDPVDHVAVEAGFAGWLALKQAYALMNDDAQAAEVTAEAAQRFVREHLAVLAEPIAAAFAGRAPEHLQIAARALVARTGPRPLDAEGDWVPQGLAVEREGFACGAEGAPESETEPDPDFAHELFAGLPREALERPPPR